MPASADVLRRQFAAFADGLDAAAEYWDPEIEWRAVEGAADDVGVIRGADALRRYYQDWIDTLAELRADVEEILREDGDRVAAVVHHSGRGRASGVPVEGRYCVPASSRTAASSPAASTRPGTRLARLRFRGRDNQGVESNVEVLREILERFNETGEVDFAGRVDPECELHDRPDVPDGRVWRGVDGVREFFAKTAELFDPIHWEPKEMVAEGRHVVAMTHVVAYGATSRTPIEMDEAQLWTFRDGLITRLQGFPTIEEAYATARALDEAERTATADP